MPMRKQSLIVVVLIIFATLSQLHDLLRLIPGVREGYRQLGEFLPFPLLGELRSMVQIVVVLLAVKGIHRFTLARSISDLGVRAHIARPALFGLLATLPMWITFGIFGVMVRSIAVNSVLYLAFISPLAEELLFRGFAFGQIRRHAGWRFWPAALTTAIVFGLGHIGIHQDPGQALGVFLITGVGGILFAWIYERWHFNLWAPFWLHCLMNLNWQIFDVGESAFAGWLPTALQFTVVVFAIVLTLVKDRIPLLRSG